MKYEFVQLSENYIPGKYTINNWYVSEKLDGERCFWDGGITRGILANEIPWANTEKDYRFKNPVVATGLWTRRRKVIHAPDWWLNLLPQFPLDGELFIDRGMFQSLRKIVSKIKENINEDDWNQVKFHVFDAPDYRQVFPKNTVIGIESMAFIEKTFPDYREKDLLSIEDLRTRLFDQVYKRMMRYQKEKMFGFGNDKHSVIRLVEQTRLSSFTYECKQQLEKILESIVDQGGEGVMIKNGGSGWHPHRSNYLLKYKKTLDSECKVVGYTWGQGKYQGMLGALIVEWYNKDDNDFVEFELSGFTDEERFLTYNKRKGNLTAISKDGKKIDDNNVTSSYFPLNSKITFKYQELSEDGVPLKARYFRKA